MKRIKKIKRNEIVKKHEKGLDKNGKWRKRINRKKNWNVYVWMNKNNEIIKSGKKN